jgi:hypothetical protein
MAQLAQATDYSDKDFDSLRLRLQNLVRSVFPEWTDFNVASFGNVLLELFAFVGDLLGFYQDNQARESRIATATQRKNLIALTKLLGFRPAGARAATADGVFTLAAVPAAQVTLRAGTRVRTASVTAPVVFQLLDDVTIPAGASPPTATGALEHSEPQEELFASSRLPNQEVALPATPFLDGSAFVSAGNGSYSEVPNFLGSGAADRHFIVVVDQSDRATIRFGNGVNGVIPSGTITVGYKTGGGAKGNVNERRLSEVARALMLTSNEDAGIAENTGILYVIPRGGGLPSQALKDAVRDQVTVVFPSTLTFQVAVQDPNYLAIDVQATVFLRQGANAAAVRSAIQKALADFFAVSLPDGTPNPNVDFGFNLKDAAGDPTGEIALSDVFNVVRDVTGVRKVGDGSDDFLLDGAREDVPIDVREFPVLGVVTLLNGDTGLPL